MTEAIASISSQYLSDRPVRNWIDFRSGFTQTEGGRTALERLQRRVNQTCAGADTIITLNPWHDKTKPKAQRIANWLDEWSDQKPRIVVIGYSYGGASAVRLCRDLQRHGLPVEALLLCDAVGRWFARWPSFLSLLNWYSLTIPANVRQLWTWRQDNDTPRGSRIKLAKTYHATEGDNVNAGTVWVDDVTVQEVSHIHMDDHVPFLQKVLAVACPERDRV